MRELSGCAVAVLVAAAALGACKGETKYKDSPATVDKLTKCENFVGEKDKMIQQLQARVAELEAKGGDEFTVTMTDPIQISGKDTGKHTSVQVDVEKYAKAFWAHVNGSRGAIRKCYQTALKKDSSLQARSITLNISVKFNTSGKSTGVSMDKRISDHFSACMKGVTHSWTIPSAPKSLTFRASVELTPQ